MNWSTYYNNKIFWCLSVNNAEFNELWPIGCIEEVKWAFHPLLVF